MTDTKRNPTARTQSPAHATCETQIVDIGDGWSVEVQTYSDEPRPWFMIYGPKHLALRLMDSSDGNAGAFLNDALAAALALQSSPAKLPLRVNKS